MAVARIIRLMKDQEKHVHHLTTNETPYYQGNSSTSKEYFNTTAQNLLSDLTNYARNQMCLY